MISSEKEPICAVEDINAAFEDIALGEERIAEQGYRLGLERGRGLGEREGYHLGYHRGSELGAELGFYRGFLEGMEDLYQRLEEIISYAVKVLPLANAHIVNFFTHDLWEVYLPSSIRTELAGCDMNVAFDLIWHHWKFGLATNALPALSQFLDRAASMSVGSQDGIALTMEDLQEKLCSWGFGNREGLKFEQFMPRKKTHEVEVMSYLVSNMALLTSTSRIVDIGGGKGYLGSLLALEYNLKVLGLDSSKAKTSGVERRAKKLEQLTSFVNDTTDVAGMVRQEFPGGGDGRATMGLIGLHTCGTLASACLRHFVRDEASYDFLINVGCCYNLMEEVDYAAPSYLRRRRFGMGRNARMLALQAKPRLSLLETVTNERHYFNIFSSVFRSKVF
ncbi:hypothetical protein AAG570_003304 [Ranatra chinensis]|uniref:Methyltransferase domain-containing protein n=1 Tax=Ranatra chinensis TaxID=642074 RepID=A0ABD0Y6H5_9HEMI